jgi:hypothetical protein
MMNPLHNDPAIREAAAVIEEMLAAHQLFERPSREIVQRAEKLLASLKPHQAPQPDVRNTPPSHPSEDGSTAHEVEARQESERLHQIVKGTPIDLLSNIANGAGIQDASREWVKHAFSVLGSQDWRQEIEREQVRAENVDTDVRSARAWEALKAHLASVENLVQGTLGAPLGPMNIRARDIGAQHFDGPNGVPSAWFHGVAHMCKNPRWYGCVTPIAKMTIGVAVFGNPIPQAWYVAANHLQDECNEALLEGVPTPRAHAKPSIRRPAP